MPTFESTREGYRNLWNKAEIRFEEVPRVTEAADQLRANKGRYLFVERATGVPWELVAALHWRESNANFNKNQLNGQPLDQVTTWVPRGLGPFESWEESALIGMRRQGLEKYRGKWTIELALWAAEKYNGTGYFGRINSPYVWASTNLQQRGKYTSDGNYNATVWDKQIGVAALLKLLWEEDEEVKQPSPSVPVVPPTTGDIEVDDLIKTLREKGVKVTITGIHIEHEKKDNTMASLWTALAGKKTFAVSIIVMLIGLAEGVFGWDIPGVDVGKDWIDYVITGAFGIGFRDALNSIFGKK